jgi:hypothetical protein
MILCRRLGMMWVWLVKCVTSELMGDPVHVALRWSSSWYPELVKCWDDPTQIIHT